MRKASLKLSYNKYNTDMPVLQLRDEVSKALSAPLVIKTFYARLKLLEALTAIRINCNFNAIVVKAYSVDFQKD